MDFSLEKYYYKDFLILHVIKLEYGPQPWRRFIPLPHRIKRKFCSNSWFLLDIKKFSGPAKDFKHAFWNFQIFKLKIIFVEIRILKFQIKPFCTPNIFRGHTHFQNSSMKDLSPPLPQYMGISISPWKFFSHETFLMNSKLLIILFILKGKIIIISGQIRQNQIIEKNSIWF